MWLISIEDITNEKISKIMSVFSNPEEVFCSSYKRLLNSRVLSEKDVERICLSKKEYSFDREKERLIKANARFISKDHMEYPNKLKNIYNPPYGLFVKGNIIDCKRPGVAIIGARNCTEYGKKIAEHFSNVLSDNNISIISGLARGIDAYAHKGALKNKGETYAVLGCGVDICYPNENINIFTQMQQRGGIISEYPLGLKPFKWNFPARNRIISGLSDAIIIVEAKEKSGSLITAEYAIDQGKDVYAIPGRIGDELSKGCNNIIKAGAELLNSPEDVIEQLRNKYIFNKENLKKEKYAIAKEFEVVYSGLDLVPKNISTIIEETGLSSEEILGKILKMQLMNLVDEPIKGYYSRRY